MNIKNLEVGLVVKNYKELCSLLGEKVKGGDSKKAQLSNWSLYFKYHKDGNKFVIDEIYEDALEKEETRGRKSIYGDTIQLLILDLLGYKNGKITISKRKLIESLGMANTNYYGCYQNLRKLSQYLNMDINYIYDFYNVNNNNFSSILRSALDSLENKRIINYSRIKKVKKYGATSATIANDDEIELILKVEKDALVKLGYDDMNSIRKSKDWKKFNPLVEEKLHELSDIKYYYNAYEIIINKDYIDYEKNNLVSLILTKIKREEARNNLNKMIIENGNNNAHKRMINDDGNSKMSKIRKEDSYQDKYKVLNNKLVNIEYKNIIDDVVEYTDYGISQDVLHEIENLF